MRWRQVGGNRPSVSACQKTTTRKRGDTTVCDDGCLSSRSARFICDLNRHSVRSNDIGSPDSIWQRDHGPRIRKEPRCAQCWGGVARRSGGGGEEWRYMLGLGISPIRKGVGLVHTRTPFGLLACLLALLAVSLSAGPAPLDSLLLVPFRILFSPSLRACTLHTTSPGRSSKISLFVRSVPFRHKTGSISIADSPSSPPQNLPQALHTRPPKRGPLDLAAARANQRNSISSIRSPPGKTVPCPSSSPQATFLCFETQPSKHRPSSAILGSPTDRRRRALHRRLRVFVSAPPPPEIPPSPYDTSIVFA